MMQPVLDIDAYRLVEPLAAVPKAGVARRRRAETYLGGSPPMSWLSRAAAAGKAALATGIALWFKCGIRRAKQGEIRVDASLRRSMGLTKDQARRGVNELAAAGLVCIERDGRGRCKVVTLIVDATKPDGSNQIRARGGNP
jgi:hypothetical protein